MSLVGYPDFQEQAQWQSPPAVTYSAAIANGATKIFPTTGNNLFNVSNWANTQLRVFGQFAALDVECQWYDADPPTALLGHRYWTTCAAGTDTNVNIPNIGPYLRVNITNLSGVVPTLVAVIAFSNRVTAPFVCPSSSPMIVRPYAVIGAGVGAGTDATYLYAGPATLTINHDSNQGWVAVVEGFNSAGVSSEFAYAGDQFRQSGDISVGVIVPPLSAHLRIFNFGAAAHSFSAALVPDMFR